MPAIEFFYDFTSPYSYLAATQIENVAARAGVSFAPKPFVLGAVFKAVGNQGPASYPAKAAYSLKDVAAWSELYGIPFTFPDAFPINAMKAHRLVLAVADEAAAWKLSLRIYRAYWGEGQDITNVQLLADLATESGLDAPALLARTEQQDIKDRLRANTDSAIERGAFGAPTFFVGDQMFLGNDRLMFVERAARGEQVYR